MRIAVDTNVLVYAEGSNDPHRQRLAHEVLAGLRHNEFVLPVQVAAELYRYLTRKRKVTGQVAREAVASWQALSRVRADTTAAVLEAALSLAAEHRLQIFDAIILAASAEARCDLLLSEDMQDGFAWRGVTIVDPFRTDRHPSLLGALGP